MKKELIGIFVCMLLVGTIFPSVSGKLLKIDIKKNSNSFNEYILDQYQENFYPLSGSVVDVNQKIAQSFKPTLDNLAKIDLAIRRFSFTNESLTVSISKDLDGNNLISFSIPASQISDSSNSWYEFILPEVITLVPENTYFIVTETEDFSGYSWGSNFSNLYTRGCCWYYSVDNGYWNDVSIEDLAFKTYGNDNQPPNKPDIGGPPTGKPGVEYTFCITPTDPDGDSLYVMWDWGDGQNSGWLGPFESGIEICDSHVWERVGTYIITVTLRDDYGTTVTATMKIIIPRNRVSHIPLLDRLIDIFPIVERILNYIH